MPKDDGEQPGPEARHTILVVDDAEINRALLRGSLRTAYRVIEAESGSQALDMLKTETVDLVLLDVMMPGLSGYDVCREIKARQGTAFLPVVLVTALGDQEARNAGLASGADEFLTKPVDRKELILRTRALLRLREQDVTIRLQVAELKRLGALKDDFVALIVHDLRNPLAGVMGYLQLTELALRDEAPIADIKRKVVSALDAAQKLEELLGEFLQVRLLEEGELSLFRVPYSMAALAGDAIATLEGAVKAKRAKIELEPGGDAVAHMDVRLMRRAVENLLSNALKYSPAGATITVATRCTEATCAIEVADRGPGIPAEHKAKIFEKFGSVEAKQGHARRGHGLGLHLVRLVADAHGGEVGVRDREGGGSIFRFSLSCREP